MTMKRTKRIERVVENLFKDRLELGSQVNPKEALSNFTSGGLVQAAQV